MAPAGERSSCGVSTSAGYSEAAFTALTAWTLFATLKRRWLTAGVLALLAGLTRPTGVAVAAALSAAAAVQVWETLRARGTGPGWLDRPYRFATGRREIRPEQPTALWRPVTAALISPLGWLGFVAWTGLRLHEWNAYFRIQALWKSRFDFGHTTGADFRILFTRSTPVNLYIPVGACVLIAAVVLLAATAAQRQPLPFLVVSLVMVVISVGDAAYFSSRARFLLPAFPLLLPLASGLARTRNRAVLAAVLVAATAVSALYGAYLMLYSPSPP